MYAYIFMYIYYCYKYIFMKDHKEKEEIENLANQLITRQENNDIYWKNIPQHVSKYNFYLEWNGFLIKLYIVYK